MEEIEKQLGSKNRIPFPTPLNLIPFPLGTLKAGQTLVGFDAGCIILRIMYGLCWSYEGVYSKEMT